MLSRFAPNDIVPLRQLFIKYDSLLSFGYICSIGLYIEQYGG